MMGKLCMSLPCLHAIGTLDATVARRALGCGPVCLGQKSRYRVLLRLKTSLPKASRKPTQVLPYRRVFQNHDNPPRQTQPEEWPSGLRHRS